MMQVKTSNQEQDKKQSFLHIHYFVQKLADCSVSFFFMMITLKVKFS
jgi:hypothetical protein